VVVVETVTVVTLVVVLVNDVGVVEGEVEAVEVGELVGLVVGVVLE
jgi:hypothetical protein